MKNEKLNDTNFHSWKQKIVLLLSLRDLSDYIKENAPVNDDESKKVGKM